MLGGRYGYNCGRGELRGGTMLAQVGGAVLARLGLVLWALAVGFVFGSWLATPFERASRAVDARRLV